MEMQWVGEYRKLFPNALWVKKWTIDASDFIPDVMLHMWCDIDTANDVASVPCKHIVFIRRYEWYYGYWQKVDWRKVSEVIMVNDFLAKQFEKQTGIKPHVVYNAVNTAQWKFRERKHGKNIAWVGFINQKKNLPLALQILAELPDDYALHLAGSIQDNATMDYLDNIGKSIKRKIYWNGQIPHAQMDLWLEDKNYILSTAISEGCPNNVIEAMAKGIKPVVHDWTGAREQFGEAVFDTIPEAVKMMTEEPYESKKYLEKVENSFGLSNYQKVKEIVNNNGNYRQEH